MVATVLASAAHILNMVASRQEVALLVPCFNGVSTAAEVSKASYSDDIDLPSCALSASFPDGAIKGQMRILFWSQ